MLPSSSLSRGVSAFLAIVALTSIAPAAPGPWGVNDCSPPLVVRWGQFTSNAPIPGMPTTVSFGGGHTVDVTVTTGGTQGVTGSNYGALGATETGLGYDVLEAFGVFNGGGTGAVPTTVTFSNFVLTGAHQEGFLLVAAWAQGFSSNITATSSVPGAVETWTQVGSTFPLGPSNSAPVSWNPLTGQFISGGQGPDASAIVVSVGDLAQYASITLSMDQSLNDGVVFSIGERAFVPPDSFCDANDGSLAACPCGNAGLPYAGCDIPQATGGVCLHLLAQTTNPNAATIRGAGFGTAQPVGVLIRSAALDPATPVTFGDGLRCISTAITRLSVASAAGGIVNHTFGHSAGPGTFHYQIWFRSLPAPYCTPSGFNLSNGRTLVW